MATTTVMVIPTAESDNTNTATVFGAENDPDTDNNTSEVVTTVNSAEPPPSGGGDDCGGPESPRRSVSDRSR